MPFGSSPPLLPNQSFAWGVFLILAGLTGLAALIDLRTATIPKWLTLATLGLGFLANMARERWLAQQGHRLWLLDNSGWWAGAIDGFLFALIGALVAFVVMFLLWILGTCGGGDVKLLTAVGAWVGLYDFPWILAASIVVLAVFFLIKVVTGGVSTSNLKNVPRPDAKLGRDRKAKTNQASKRRMTYSLPIFLSVVVVLLVQYGPDLGLQEPRPETHPPQVQRDAQP